MINADPKQFHAVGQHRQQQKKTTLFKLSRPTFLWSNLLISDGKKNKLANITSHLGVQAMNQILPQLHWWKSFG